MSGNLRASLMAVFVIILASAGSTPAQLLQDDVQQLEGVGVDERLEAVLPLDLQFKDSSGKPVRLRELISGERPALLSLNYSDCPMLCRLQLNGLVDGLRDMRLEPGEDFDIISVSIDPAETPQRARQTKQNYIKAYGRPRTASGWHFLCGSRAAIDELADVVGFRYRYVPERKEYAHAAVTLAITPQGVVSRYLYGIIYPPRTLRLALVEAAEGKIGTTLDRVLLFCLHYDPATGRYAPVARKLMQAGAAATLVALAVTLLPVWLRRHRRRHAGRPVESERAARHPEVVHG